ncbi:MAG: tRNA lysidine(34) synthetase TilS [Alphaproteobacteria bacterium]
MTNKKAKLIEYIEQHLAKRLALPDMASYVLTEEKILVGLSGGGDSLALTHLLKKWCDQQGKKLYACYINHGVRAIADEEEKILQKNMAELGIEFLAKKLPPLGDKKNWHHRARVERMAMFCHLAKMVGARVVMLAHQENDIAENLLMRLSRRAGLYGLSAMEDIVVDTRGVVFLKPLLAIGRDSLASYLAEQGIVYFHDAHNQDDRYLRARTRKSLQKLQDDNIVCPADIAQSARYLRLASHFVDKMVAEKKSSVVFQENNLVVLYRQDIDGGLTAPFLLHYWLRAIMAKWQGEKNIKDYDFPPPQDQLDKILAADKCQETIFSYPDYWLASDDKKIIIIKKSPDNILTIAPKEKIIWNNVAYVENTGEDICNIGSLRRGKNFLKNQWGKNFVGLSVDRFLSPTTSRYFYESQPKIFTASPDDYCLPSLGLTSHALSIRFSPMMV